MVIDKITYYNFREKISEAKSALDDVAMENGLSLKALSRKMGMNYLTLTKFLQGKETITYPCFIKIVKFINSESKK